MFMNKIFAHQQFFKGHMMTIIGVMLCFYFSYHTIFGHRSILTLHNLNSQIENAVAYSDNLQKQRHNLERKVVSMRPDSINPDMVEERARTILGYKRADEIHILSH